jgi:hypothetical protein
VIDLAKTGLHKCSRVVPLISDSLKLLFSNPVLFVPKLIIAILYGIGTLVAANLAKQLFSFQSLTNEQILNFDFSFFFLSFSILLILTLFSFFVDLFFCGFYPVLVKLALEKKLSFKTAFDLVKPKLFKIFLSGVLLWLLITFVSVIEAVIIFYFNLSNIGFILSLLVDFVFVFFFYFLYPKLVFESMNLGGIFKDSFFVSLRNNKLVFLLSVIPFLVSVIKFGLAYFSDSSLFLVIFWVLVVLTGFVYAVHAVVNQLAYENLPKLKN